MRPTITSVPRRAVQMTLQLFVPALNDLQALWLWPGRPRRRDASRCRRVEPGLVVETMGLEPTTPCLQSSLRSSCRPWSGDDSPGHRHVLVTAGAAPYRPVALLSRSFRGVLAAEMKEHAAWDGRRVSPPPWSGCYRRDGPIEEHGGADADRDQARRPAKCVRPNSRPAPAANLYRRCISGST